MLLTQSSRSRSQVQLRNTINLVGMNRLLAISATAVLCMASACSERQEIPSAFVGTWRCDEALTLKGLDESKSVTPSDMKMFKDDFFGDRKFVFRPFEYDAYWIGEDWGGVWQDVTGMPYDIVDSGPDYLTVRIPESEYVEAKEIAWRVDGEYIFVDLSPDGWDFKEYYRRIEPD